MAAQESSSTGNLLHIVTLECKDAARAAQCINALTAYGRRDALAFNCVSYEFGFREGSSDTVILVERWREWLALDALLSTRFAPALPMYNQFLKRPFDPARDTLRVNLAGE